MTEPMRSAGTALPHPTTPTSTAHTPPPHSERAREAARDGAERETGSRARPGRPSIGFRERLKDLLPGGTPTACTTTRAGRHGALGAERGNAGQEAASLAALELAGRTASSDEFGSGHGRDRGTGTRSSSANDPLRELDPTHPAATELSAFRVGPSILAPPIARAVMEPAASLDPAQFSAEIVESLRVGRFGREGHALTMRVRGARSAIDVDLRSENGRLALRMSGDDDAEVARVRARVRADLAARGIEVDDA